MLPAQNAFNQNLSNTECVGVITSGSVEQLALPGYTKNSTKEFEELRFIWFTKKLKNQPIK